ncbi:hypothetical protein HIE55_004268 [Escherichia coli]|nr:hypothetical protein [Escherichia coli]
MNNSTKSCFPRFRTGN